MKTVVLDNYREVAQTISYEDGMVVIDRKKAGAAARVMSVFFAMAGCKTSIDDVSYTERNTTEVRGAVPRTEP